ncbi:MAG: hypothetical protein ACM3PZ_02245 [Bacillota bacterium]
MLRFLNMLKGKVKMTRAATLIPAVILIFASFLLAPHAFAAAEWAGEILGSIIGAIIWALGQILVLVVKCLILVASYQDFINQQGVIEGWRIVRDLANMFFVVVLLIIAFSTILNYENYSYRKWLPKLVLMAILVNFSKTICGLLIDVTQIVMLTFVNSFKDIAGGNLIDMLGIRDVITFANSSEDAGFWAIIGAYVLGLIYMIISLVVITTMLMILVMRLVMIWIYVVLSPLAYLLSAFPGGGTYASKWWSDFTKNLIVGPVLAFFIWLSLMMLQTGNDVNYTAADNEVSNDIGQLSDEPVSVTEASRPSALIKFVLAIGMLIGGLKIAQEIGGSAGSIAGKGMSRLNKMGSGAMAFGKGALVGGATSVGLGLAKKVKLKDKLGTVASQSGVLGKALAATGVRGLATRSLVGLNKAQKKVSDKAEAKINDLKDARVIGRYVKEGGGITAMGQALKSKAADKMPSALGNPVKIADALAGMSKETMGKLSDAEWHAIGKSGAALRGRALSYVQRNSDERGAYNYGRQDAHLATFVPGMDSKGNTMQNIDRRDPGYSENTYGSYMNATRPPSPDDLEELRREGKHRTDYLVSKNKVVEEHESVPLENQEQPRGNGNTAINGFAKGNSVMAVDFDKLGIPEIKKGAEGDKDWRNTRGINTTDPTLIGKIAEKMSSVIGSEIFSLEAKPIRTQGEEVRLSNLKEAQTRLADPKALSNVQLVNSSAADYKVGDVKETMIHESIHAQGIDNEKDVESATQKIIETRNYAARSDRSQIDDILKEKPETKKPQDIVFDEEEKGMAVKIDASQATASLDNFAEKLNDLELKFAAPKGGDLSKVATRAHFARWFKSLGSKVASGGKETGGVLPILGADKAETPLEMDVIYNQLPKVSDFDNPEIKA